MIYPHTTLTLTLTLTTSHPLTTSLFRQEAYCLPGILWMGVRFNGQGAKKQRFTGSIAMVYCWCSYAALLVQGCCTFGARMFYSSGTARTFDIPMLDCQYSYAGLSVFLCWTVGIAMLNLWYTYAVPLVPECYTLLVPFFYLIYSQYFKFDLSQFTYYNIYY